MYILMRRSLGLVLSVSALLGPLIAKRQARFRPGTVNPALINPALNPALRLNPALGLNLRGSLQKPYCQQFPMKAAGAGAFDVSSKHESTFH
jgi:hypothetical protein